MFHPQATEIQSFKVECFSTKTLKFQRCDTIIYDVSVDFAIFCMLISLVISYACVKFLDDMIINNGITCIFHVFLFCVF